MHELSIAHQIVQTIVDTARQHNANGVTSVQLQIGAISGVVVDALRYSFDVAAHGTLVEGARLDIEEVAVAIYCEQCKEEHILSSVQSFRCPVCVAPSAHVIRGREMDIISIEIQEQHERATAS